MNVNSRLKEIEELESFISNKEEILKSVLDSLEWTEESLTDDMKVRCPINPGHWILESSTSHHKEICEWVEDGYQKEELAKQPPDSKFFYEKASNVIPVVIDKPTLETILTEKGLGIGNVCKDIPKTADRWATQFSPEQRLAVYDYIVNVSKTVEKSKNVTLEDLMIDFEKKEEQDDKPKSQLEIMAEMRDYKRRRQSYRAKNVHITKKSYTEIMKEVIENQTNYLVETRKYDGFEDSRKDYEDSNGSKRKYNYDSNDYDSSEDKSSKCKDHHSEYRRDESDSRKHSKHKSSKHHSPKRKKHKKDRSRSRSPSYHKHKKSHKRKHSRD